MFGPRARSNPHKSPPDTNCAFRSPKDMPTLQRSEPFANQPSIAADVPEGAEAVTLQG